MLCVDWTAVSAIGVAGAAVAAAAATFVSIASLKAARRSADAALELVAIEADRRAVERIRDASSRGLVAHETAGVSTVRVIRLFNVGPGPVTIDAVAVEQENGQEARGLRVTLSDEYPITLRRGEYTRIDLTNPGVGTRYRLSVNYFDESGEHSGYRVRTQLSRENPVPLES